MTVVPQQILVGDAYLPLLDGTIRDRFVLFESRRGTGKTYAILVALVCRALRWPRTRWLLARSTRTRLTETVLVTLEEMVLPAFGITVPGASGRDNRHSYELPNGSLLVTMGLDDPQRSTSAEFAGIYVAEAIELERLDDVVGLAGTMRQAVADPDFFHQCIVDCNPGAPGHWLNQAAEPFPREWRVVETREQYQRLLDHGRAPRAPDRWKRVVTSYQDNPHYFDVDAWDFTRAGDDYYNETLAYLRGHLRSRWLQGLWVSAEGGVFPEFDEDRHVIKPFKVPAHWPHYWWWDPGYDHPTGLVCVAVAATGTGTRYYVVDEIKQGGLDVESHCNSLKEHNRRAPGRMVLGYYGDPMHAFSSTAQSPETIAAKFRRHMGVSMYPGPRMNDKGHKEAAVERVREWLIGPKDPAGNREPRIKVFDHCVETINEFQSWKYRRDTKDQILKGDDQFEDKNNDILDGILGLVDLNLPAQAGSIRVVRS